MMGEQDLIWPNFYIVGAVKCGTTSLWAHLRQHPEVFLPEMKEPHFFATNIGPTPPAAKSLHCPGDLGTYQRLYTSSSSFPAIGDASPSYLADEDAPRRIHEVCPLAR